jgi:hypothetical protein
MVTKGALLMITLGVLAMMCALYLYTGAALSGL